MREKKNYKGKQSFNCICMKRLFKSLVCQFVLYQFIIFLNLFLKIEENLFIKIDELNECFVG